MCIYVYNASYVYMCVCIYIYIYICSEDPDAAARLPDALVQGVEDLSSL